jgi:hypothetical protein
VLPAANLRIRRSGVFWPVAEDPLYRPVVSSGHRMAWTEVEPTGEPQRGW